MTTPFIASQNLLAKYFAYAPTSDQLVAFNIIESFLEQENNTQCLILEGSAGTGKTTIVKAIVEFLASQQMNFRLAAPTGRAAKILASKTGQEASTIHNLIYTIQEIKDKDGNIEKVRFVRRINVQTKPTVYIIDEASMIGDINDKTEADYFQTDRSILEDFISYVKQGSPQSKILFIGDSFQLPPVKSLLSPALNEEYLQHKFNLECMCCQISQVKRQGSNSYILDTAVRLREAITHHTEVEIILEELASEEESISTFKKLYKRGSTQEVVFIAWRNEITERINQKIRRQLFINPKRLEGECIVVNRTHFNNPIMIASGESGIVQKVYWQSLQQIAGISFVKADLSFTNGKGQSFTYTGQVLLDKLPDFALDKEGGLH